jgi:hypothetical protein
MTQVFFQYEKIPYLYDTKQLKLFQIKTEKLVEINKPKILKNVRYNSVEINKEQAFILAQRFMK